MQDRIRLHTVLLGVSAAHRSYSMSRFYALGLTAGQPKVLYFLLQREGEAQKQLARRCHIEPATLSSILKSMCERDLVYKQAVSGTGGKRAYTIFLTEHGRAVAQQVNQIVEEAEVLALQGFQPEEWQALLCGLRRIQENLEEMVAREGRICEEQDA